VVHWSVVWVKPGNNAAVKVLDRVQEHDKIYLIVEDMTEHVPA